MAVFDCATYRPVVNQSGRLSPNLGLILHHAVANGSLYNLFNSPSSQVSAHFWVSLNGDIEQYVDTSACAWHARDLNGSYVGVETEGCATSPYAQPMTQAMVNALGRLYSEGMRRHGWPPALCNAKGQPGFGYHRLPGSQNAAGASYPTACPCDVRVSRRQDVLNAATGSAPPTPPTLEDVEMISATSTGKGYWTVTRDGAIYAFGDAQNKGSPYATGAGRPGGLAPGASIVGIAGHQTDGYWLLATDGGVFAYGSAQFYGRPDRV